MRFNGFYPWRADNRPPRLARVSPSRGELSILYGLTFGGRDSGEPFCLRPEFVGDHRYADLTR
jgi:hypothetical protein